MTGAYRAAAHWVYSGQDRLSVRPGLVTQMTLLDDQGSPAAVTTVCCIQPFSDGAIAVAYSTVTQKAYLYRLNATLTGWFDHTGATHTTTAAQPIAIVWSSMGAAPEVLCAEGLGTLYIANTAASSSSVLAWPTMTWADGTWNGSGLVVLTALAASGTYVNNVQTAGPDTAYFLGVISFQQALWGWGYGSGTTPANGYRPELLRFSSPSFGLLMLTDSFTIGDRVRSLRERVIGAGVAGESLFVASAETLVRITGQGRDTWVKQSIDRSFGMVGPKAGVTVGDYFYYYSSRGPMRIEGLPQAYGLPPKPEPLFDVVYQTIESTQNEAKTIAWFDPDHDQVGWMIDTGTGQRTMLTYDTRRSRFVTAGADFGVVPQCWGNVKPIYASTVTPQDGPAGPPTSAFVTNISSNGATLNWTVGDPNAQTMVQITLATDTAFANPVLTLPTFSAGTTQVGFSSSLITPGTAYIWRVWHVLNAIASAFLAPPAPGTSFTTAAQNQNQQLPAPTGLSAGRTFTLNAQKQPQPLITLRWTNTASAASTLLYGGSTGSLSTGNFGIGGSVGPGVSSLQIQFGVSSTVPEFWYAVHRETGFADSNPSNIAQAF